MNEQLQKLDNQACEYASSRIDNTDEDWGFQWDRDYSAKFAELIVMECVSLLEMDAAAHDDNDVATLANAVRASKYNIKHYFGIE